MWLLCLENFASIDISQNPDEEREQKWNVVGVSASTSFSNTEIPNRRRLQAILQEEREFAAIDVQTLQISLLDTASTLSESCIALNICADGKTMFGMDRAGNFLALCNNLTEQKEFRPPNALKARTLNGSIYNRVVSKVRDVLGYVDPILRSSPVTPQSDKSESFQALFPILQSTSNGLGVLYITKPGEAFLFTCNYSVALLEKHVSNIIGAQIPGHWWNIAIDEEIILNWLEDKPVPVISTQINYNSDSMQITGTILYAAFVDRRLEILSGRIGMEDIVGPVMVKNGLLTRVDTAVKVVDKKYVLNWGLISYDFDWVISEDNKEIPVGKTNFVTKLSAKSDKIAIAVNTYMGVYIHVQDLPGTESKIKLQRMTVPICAHCDYETKVYYDEECWISSIEWIASDSFFACTTRCGCLSVFYKTGELVALTIRKHEDPTKDSECNYFQQVFNIRGRTSENANHDSLPTVKLKWAGFPENVLVVTSGSELVFFDIRRAMSQFDVSDIKIPTPVDTLNLEQSSLNLTKDEKARRRSNSTISQDPTVSQEITNGNEKKLFGDCNNVNCADNFLLYDESIFKEFMNNLPQAEIVLRPVIIDPNQKAPTSTVQFKFHNDRDWEAKVVSDDQLSEETSLPNDDLEPPRPILSLPDLQTSFELTARSPPQYMADDEMTDIESRTETAEHYPEESRSNVTDEVLQDLSDDSYSPPFTDDEDENISKNKKYMKKAKKKSEDDLHSEQCMLSMPSVPHIDGVIPFVFRIPVSDEETELLVEMTPCIEPKCVTSSTQTDNDIDSSAKCTPICISPVPPPPSTKPLTRGYSIMSPLNEMDICDMHDFINNIQDDFEPFNLKEEYRLALLHGAYKGEEEEDDTTNNNIQSAKSGSPESETMDDDEHSDQEPFFNLDGTSICLDKKKKIKTVSLEESSRKTWEQISGKFEKKAPTRRNKQRMKLKPEPSNSSSINADEDNLNVVPKKKKPVKKTVEAEDTKSSKNILKPILKQSTNVKLQARPEEDPDIIKTLKNLQVNLKRRQEESKIENGLSRFMSDWMNSSKVSPMNLHDRGQLLEIKNKQTRLQAVSQPNFQTPIISPTSGLKKVTFSEPELTTRKVLKTVSSTVPQTFTKAISATAGKKTIKTSMHEFTVGGPPMIKSTPIQLKKNSKLESVIMKQVFPAASSTPKVTSKSQSPKAETLKNQSVSTVVFPYIPKKPQSPKASGSSGMVNNRPVSCPSVSVGSLLGSPSNKTVSNKSQPSLPIKKRSRSICLKKKKSSTPAKRNVSPRPTSVEQREEEIENLKSSLIRLTKEYGSEEYKAAAIKLEKSSSRSNSPASSSKASSRKASASPSENSIRIQSASKSPKRPRSMEALKQKMLRELQYEMRRSDISSSDSSGNNSEDDKRAAVATEKRNLGRGLTIHTEVMEDVPLRPYRGGKSDEDYDSDYSRISTHGSERMQRRVSFSDPIAVFKTMSPPSLLKTEDNEMERLELRRIHKRMFNFKPSP